MLRKPLSGFTLVELLVAIGIVALLAALAMPSFQAMIASQQIRSAASALQSGLLLTRAEALKQNANVELMPTTAGQWSLGWAALNIQTTPASVIASYPAYAALTITGPASVTYQSSGRISATANAAFKLSSLSTPSYRCVTVTTIGVPTVTSSGC